MPSTTSSRITTAVASAGAALLRQRWFARAPIWLYRARLGAVFGSRLLMLEHTGRTTGARRYVTLEVVSRPAPDRYVVVSGFGTRAQWFRNVRANPRVRVYLGSRRPRAAVARILASEESAAALSDYASSHPRAWRTLRPVLETTLGARIDSETTTLPLVALELEP